MPVFHQLKTLDCIVSPAFVEQHAQQLQAFASFGFSKSHLRLVTASTLVLCSYQLVLFLHCFGGAVTCHSCITCGRPFVFFFFRPAHSLSALRDACCSRLERLLDSFLISIHIISFTCCSLFQRISHGRAALQIPGRGSLFATNLVAIIHEELDEFPPCTTSSLSRSMGEAGAVPTSLENCTFSSVALVIHTFSCQFL